MPVIDTSSKSAFFSSVQDLAKNVFFVSLFPTIGILAYLLYGLFSGQLADASVGKASAQTVHLVGQLSFYLNLSLIVTLLTSLLLFYEYDALGYALVASSGILAYGIKFSIDFLFSSDAARLTKGAASSSLLQEFTIAAMMIGAPGVILLVKNIISRMIDRPSHDLSTITYGKDVAEQQKRPTAMIGAFAACWQLPFCRDGIRIRCPIFHAKTRCWKQRVGCMCEENIIILAMGSEDNNKTKDIGASVGAGGFVPIGDILTKSAEQKKANIPTRVGPRGVRIPTNPHLTDAQKRMRCHNCIIYNEHQRQKYQLLSGPLALMVPVLVFWQYPNLLIILANLLGMLDSLITHLSFDPSRGNTISLSQGINGNIVVETVMIVCLTLVVMAWAQRALEYAVFKLKI